MPPAIPSARVGPAGYEEGPAESGSIRRESWRGVGLDGHDAGRGAPFLEPGRVAADQAAAAHRDHERAHFASESLLDLDGQGALSGRGEGVVVGVDVARPGFALEFASQLLRVVEGVAPMRRSISYWRNFATFACGALVGMKMVTRSRLWLRFAAQATPRAAIARGGGDEARGALGLAKADSTARRVP